MELNRLWKVETKVIPTAVEALNTVTKRLQKNLRKVRTVSSELLYSE